MTTTTLLTNPYLDEDAILLDYCTEEGYGPTMDSNMIDQGGANCNYNMMLNMGGAPASSHTITVKVQTPGTGYNGKIIYSEATGDWKGAGSYPVLQTWGCPGTSYDCTYTKADITKAIDSPGDYTYILQRGTGATATIVKNTRDASANTYGTERTVWGPGWYWDPAIGTDNNKRYITVAGYSLAGTAYIKIRKSLSAGITFNDIASIALGPVAGNTYETNFDIGRYNDRLVIVSDDGVSVFGRFSNDEGYTWTDRRGIGNGTHPTIAADKKYGQLVIAYHDSGTIRSSVTDDGYTYTARGNITTGTQPSLTRWDDISILCAAVSTNSMLLLRSTDGACTWSMVTPRLLPKVSNPCLDNSDGFIMMGDGACITLGRVMDYHGMFWTELTESDKYVQYWDIGRGEPTTDAAWADKSSDPGIMYTIVDDTIVINTLPVAVSTCYFAHDTAGTCWWNNCNRATGFKIDTCMKTLAGATNEIFNSAFGFEAPINGASYIEGVILVGESQVSLYDGMAATVLGVTNYDCSDYVQFRVAVKNLNYTVWAKDGTTGSGSTWTKLFDDATNGALAPNASGTTEIYWGDFDGTSGAQTTWKWFRYSTDGDDGMADGFTNPGDLTGRGVKVDDSAMHVSDSIWCEFHSSTFAGGDSWSAVSDYDYPVRKIFTPRIGDYWRSSGQGATFDIVLDAEAGMTTGARFHADSVAIFGSNVLNFKFQMNATNEWTSPTIDETVSSQRLDLHGTDNTLECTSFGDGYIQCHNPSLASWRLVENECKNLYCAVAWKTEGISHYKISANTQDTLIFNETYPLVSGGSIQDVWIYGPTAFKTFTATTARYAKISIAAGTDTVDEFFKIGYATFGLRWDINSDWLDIRSNDSRTETHQGNLIINTSDGGQEYIYKQGDMRRKFELEFLNASATWNENKSALNVRQIEEFLRFTEMGKFPVVYVPNNSATNRNVCYLTRPEPAYSKTHIVGDVWKPSKIVLQELV